MLLSLPFISSYPTLPISFLQKPVLLSLHSFILSPFTNYISPETSAPFPFINLSSFTNYISRNQCSFPSPSFHLIPLYQSTFSRNQCSFPSIIHLIALYQLYFSRNQCSFPSPSFQHPPLPINFLQKPVLLSFHSFILSPFTNYISSETSAFPFISSYPPLPINFLQKPVLFSLPFVSSYHPLPINFL